MVPKILVAALLAATTATLAAQSNTSFETYAVKQQTDYSNGFNPGIVSGDFNNDGKPDIVQCCNSNEQLMFLAGNGDGTFQAPTVAWGTPVDAPDLVAADVNGDGKLDLIGVAAINPPEPPASASTYELMVWMGNGNGTFQTPQTYGLNGSFGPAPLVVGNFFGDGRPDIAVGTTGNTVAFFRNEGNGSYVYDKTVDVGSGTSSMIQLAAGDLNGNGLTDLAVMTEDPHNGAVPEQLTVLWNNGKGNFTQTNLGDYTTPEITISRLNGTAQKAIVMSYACTPKYPATSCVGFDAFYGQGNDKIYKRALVRDSEGIDISQIGQIYGVDVNGDGIGDIVAVGASLGSANPPQGLFVWQGNANGSFAQVAQHYYVSSQPGEVGPAVMADFTRNGMMDFVQPNTTYSVLQVYLNSTARTMCGEYTISPTVTECQPVDNTYAPGAVPVEAKSFDTTQVTAMQEYVDGTLEYSKPVTQFERSFPMSTGMHSLVTKAWDASGRSFRAVRTVTVYKGMPGAVCPTAPSAAAICLPSGATSNSPVHILANGNTPYVPTAAQLYIDGKLVVNDKQDATYVDTWQKLTGGQHSLVFKLWDSKGHDYTAQKTVTVQ